jgi:hypothetical protein
MEVFTAAGKIKHNEPSNRTNNNLLSYFRLFFEKFPVAQLIKMPRFNGIGRSIIAFTKAAS